MLTNKNKGNTVIKLKNSIWLLLAIAHACSSVLLVQTKKHCVNCDWLSIHTVTSHPVFASSHTRVIFRQSPLRSHLWNWALVHYLRHIYPITSKLWRLKMHIKQPDLWCTALDIHSNEWGSHDNCTVLNLCITNCSSVCVTSLTSLDVDSSLHQCL